MVSATIAASIVAAVGKLSLDSLTATEVTQAVTKSASCCAALAYGFNNTKVSYGGQSAYQNSLASYWSNQESGIHPSCIVSPTTAQDVQKAVAIISIGAIAWGDSCKFAVKGGGHAPFAGFANIAGGITIDLAAINAVTLSADKTTVDIGPGAKWQKVYETLDAHGVATQGGRVASVGVPGLVLGGGISFFSGRYGFVCDSVEVYQLVLASGSIVNVTSTSYPDLFLALKGGSNNFGIVTKLTMQTFKQGNFWGGNIGTPIAPQAYIPAVAAFANSAYPDKYAALMSTFAISSSAPYWLTISSLEYTKSSPAVTNPPVFANFTAFPQIFNTMRVSNLTDFTTELDGETPYGLRQLFATISVKPDVGVLTEIFNLANATAQSLLFGKNVTNLSFDLLYEPLPVSALPKTAATTNSLGLDQATGNLVVVLLDCSWADQKDDGNVHAATRNLFASIKTMAQAAGAYNNYYYLNYAGQFQNPIAGYGAASVASLQAASKKYDPSGTFQKMVPGGFKLPTS